MVDSSLLQSITLLHNVRNALAHKWTEAIALKETNGEERRLHEIETVRRAKQALDMVLVQKGVR